MNKLSLILILMLAIGTTFANESSEKSKDHSSHDHGEETKSKVKKKKHDDHDSHSDHSKHEGEDSHDDHSDHDDLEGKGAHSDHDDHDDHGGGKAIGKGKAIESVDEKKGFKLSKEAIKTLELKLQTVDGDEFTITKTTLVTSKSIKGLYRFRGGFFKFMTVKLLKEVDGKYLVKVSGVEFGDQIVTNGTGLLRVTDVYSTDTSEYGHSH